MAASRSPVRASMSASSFVGEMSISAARSCALVRWLMQLLPAVTSWWCGSCLDVGDELVHQARDEADGADRLAVGHSRRPEHDADGPAGLAVRGEDERDVAHLLGAVLGADERRDLAGPGDRVEQAAEVRAA